MNDLHVHEHDPSKPLPPELKARLAGSFGTAAGHYRQFRPDYPAEAVRAALGGRPAAVLDLGAGTGKLTAVLAGELEAAALTAVEPDPQMLATLRQGLPGVSALAGSAEQIPLPDTSVDVVVVGQALHWFDLDLALPEIGRVLRPNGRLAALWNVHDTTHPFTAAFEEQLDRHVRPAGGATGRSATPGSAAPPSAPFSGRTGFTDPQLQEFNWRRPITAGQLHGLVDTLSYVITADADRRSALHADLDRLVHSWTGPAELAENCQVWVSTRA